MTASPSETWHTQGLDQSEIEALLPKPELPEKIIEEKEKSKPKGELIFDCDFESGNIGDIEQVDEFEFDVKIRCDSNSPKHRVWYFFRVRNMRENQKLVIHVSNYSKSKALFREGFTPVWATHRRKWTPVNKEQMFYYRCPRHKKRHCFAFTFSFKTCEEHFFAFTFPYTYTFLQKWLHSIDMLNLSFFRKNLLCRTIKQRRLDLLTITNPENSHHDKGAIVVSSRIHPGETPASYLCHGLVEFLISNHPVAQFLRKETIFYIIPMLNPDGVCCGNYRCHSAGLDLNRHWRNPNWRTHPTITAVKMLLRQLKFMQGVQLDFFIDLHAHSTATNAFTYCNLFDDNPKKNALTTVFPRLLDMYCSDFLFDKSKFCRNPKKAGSGRCAMGDVLTGHTCCYTLEVSFFCSSHNNVLGPRYTPGSFVNIGRNIARAFGDMYRVPADCRHDLTRYNLPHIRPMKGGVVIIDDHNDEGSNDEDKKEKKGSKGKEDDD